MRPKFLDRPPRYVGSSRDRQGPVTYAASLEKPAPRKRDWQDRLVLWACTLAAIALAALGYFK